ncbi:MAG TPA: hypothetical protein VF940_32710 [Streptosporangiaceae bacterium]
MHTPAILAAKHAALGSGVGLGAIPVIGWASLDGVAVSMLLAAVGFAAVSSRRVQSCPLQATPGHAGPAAASLAAAGRLARFRQRVDELLTGMLSDDPRKMTPAPATAHLAARRAALADERLPAAAAWSGDYVEALAPARSRAAAGPHSVLSLPSETCDDDEVDGYDEIMSSLAEQFSYADDRLQPVKDPGELKPDDVKPDEPKPVEPKPDESFWGPGAADDVASASGHRSKRRAGGEAKDAEPHRGRRANPRHAAPPATFGATVARGLTGAKLTSRSAAHAGG